MGQDTTDASCIEDGAKQTALQCTLVEGSSPASLRREAACIVLSVPVLAAQCSREIDNYRRGEPCNETYGLELLRRCTIQGDQEARTWLQDCLGGLVRGWLRRHPSREAACRLESEENYVVQAFERFWLATTLTHRAEFRTLAAALQYLRASLNGAILDTRRAYSRSRGAPLPESGEPGESFVEEHTDSSEVWDVLQMVLTNEREQRLAYLLYHCGLGPREIVRFYSGEYSDVQEIYRVRRTIMERLLRNADHLRWRFS
jgi:hypothetical protein